MRVFRREGAFRRLKVEKRTHQPQARNRMLNAGGQRGLRLVLLGEHLGVHTLGLHAGLGGVGDVALVVLEALEGATAGLLGLLLLGDLGGLVLDLTSASEGAVDLTHVV